jgi:phosphoserine phosphatase
VSALRGRVPPPHAFAAVYFDCDSTLSAIEGVDELAAGLPPHRRAELLALTQRAMDGSQPPAHVYGPRLRAIAPRRDQLLAIGRLYVERAVPDAREVIAALHRSGKRTGIVSGGLLPAVEVLAAHLGIAAADVHAVPLQFDAAGAYSGFDRSSPLARNGGKAEVLASLPKDRRPLAFVGDGATDLETMGTADLFVGYGGVAIRTAVRDDAEAWFETPSLAPMLRLVLTQDELRALERTEFAALLSRARA